jgi:hypothetical protein
MLLDNSSFSPIKEWVRTFMYHLGMRTISQVEALGEFVLLNGKALKAKDLPQEIEKLVQEAKENSERMRQEL